MKKPKKEKKARWPDYRIVEMPKDIITFGTSIFQRKDGRAFRILFPAGQTVTLLPEGEIDTPQNI